MKPAAAAATHVALLRGINVGRAKRIAMADLRGLVEGLGYRGVRTLLNSGNVVFTAPGVDSAAAASRIEKAMDRTLGVTARVTVLTAKALLDAVRDSPLGDVADNPSRTFVAVLADPADRKRLLAVQKETWTPEVFALGSRVAYLWCPRGALDSPLFTAVARLLKDAVTTRNWATMTKLADMIGEVA